MTDGRDQGCLRLHPSRQASAAFKRYEILLLFENGAGSLVSRRLLLGSSANELSKEQLFLSSSSWHSFVCSLRFLRYWTVEGLLRPSIHS